MRIKYRGTASSAGAKWSEIELASNATVNDLFQLLAARYPDFAQMLKQSPPMFTVARNHEFISDYGIKLENADEIVMVMPVSGGGV